MNPREEIKTPLVSVILPVYNVEPWLRECLDSLLQQTLADTEIICVNDGSTDHSPKILQDYAKQDRRIRIIDQENKGLSEARNTGIRAATGKYICFMDSDDLLDPAALELCSAKMEVHGLEYLCFNAAAFGEGPENNVTAGEINAFYRRCLDDDLLCTGQELFCWLKREDAYLAPACFCMLLRSVLSEHQLWFHPGILHEDEPWTFQVLMTVSRCGCLNRVLYRRRIRGGSITQAGKTFAHAYGCFAGYLDILDVLRNRPDLTGNKDLAEIALDHTMLRQRKAIEAYLGCKASERQKQNNLDPAERMLFMQTVALPASLKEDAERQKDENRKLNQRISDVEKEIKASASYRLGNKMLTLPRKMNGLLKKCPPARRVVQKLRHAAGPAPAEINRLDVFPSDVAGSRITCRYQLSGEWRSCFMPGSVFEITYPFSVEDVPESIRIIPFLAQVLPASWVCDAEIHVPECDADFFNCLESVKTGYRNMYPMLSFGGKLTADRLVSNTSPEPNGRPLACFSGGVDATSTVLTHLTEKPLLVSLWGSDVPWKDEEGWQPVEELTRHNAQELGLDAVTIRTSFRDLLSQKNLGNRVKSSGDNWWHGFQHGLGILGHLAPVAWKTGADTVYIASSYVAGDAVTCASDPTIDNHVRFCGARAVHDGYELCRQQKVRKIVTWTSESGKPVPLHVCWEKRGGDNCCHCEKCWRTMLALYAEGADPRDFGFSLFNGFGCLSEDLEADYRRFTPRLEANYRPIQECLRNRMEENTLPQDLSWLYHANLSELENGKKRLHNGKPVTPFYLLYTPEHTNMGDHFIAEAEKTFIRSFLPDSYCIEFTSNELKNQHLEQLSRIPASATVFINGGGFIGTIWGKAEKQLEEIITSMPQNRFVIFPQSVWFSDDEEGRKALARAKAVYKGDRILLCCRDKVSLALAQQYFDCPVLLVPDIVLWSAIRPKRPAERLGAMTILREDRERALSDEARSAIISFLASRFSSLVITDLRPLAKKIVTRATRTEQMALLVMRIASAECVVTDRLHAMILCAVTGTPCVVFGNNHHKIEASYEWIKNLGYIRLIRETGELEDAIAAVCAWTDREYPEKDMQKLFDPLVQYIMALEPSE